jgi:hypothetical protein
MHKCSAATVQISRALLLTDNSICGQNNVDFLGISIKI